MEKRVIIIHGIILAKSYEQAVCQFNAFCNNNWFTKRCKSSPVPANSSPSSGNHYKSSPKKTSVKHSLLSLTSNSTILNQRMKHVCETSPCSLGKSLPHVKSNLFK